MTTETKSRSADPRENPGVRGVLGQLGLDASIFEGSPSAERWGTLLSNRKAMRKAAEKLNDKGDALSADEQAAFDLCVKGIRAINDEADTREAAGTKEPRHATPFGLKPSRGASRSGALAPGESLAETVASGQEREVGIARLIRAQVTGDWDGVPDMRGAQNTGSGPGGGFAVPTELSARIIDLARARSRVVEAGALTIPVMTGTTNFATVEKDPEAHWRAENTEIPESEMLLGERSFRAQTLAVLVRASIELVEDAPNIDSLIEESIAAELGLKLDKMCLIGNGVGQPLGLYNTDGVHRLSPAENGGALEDYSLMSKAIEKVRSSNAEPGAFLLSARTSGELDRLINLDGDPLTPPRSVAERDWLTTNQIPDDLPLGGSPDAGDGSAIFTGQWEDFYIAMRTSIIIEATRVGGDGFKKMQVLIRGYLRADAFAVRPNHFAVIDKITPPPEA